MRCSNEVCTRADLAAIGITNQRETTVLWDRHTGQPVYNALVWQDTRVDSYVSELARDGGPDRFRDKTGLPLTTYFSGLKIRWVLDNVPGVRERAEAGDILFGNIDSYLLWNLTGGPRGGLHITDCTNASRTQLMNLHTLSWDHGLLDVIRIPEQMLPKIASSSEVYGVATLDSLKGVPVAGILGDQQAALVGQTCFNAGEAKNTYGTGCFLLMNTGDKPVASKYGLLTTVAYRLGNQPAAYALEGSIAITGALVQWIRDNFGLIAKSSDIETLARTVKDNGGVYFVPAFSGLYAPYWKASARGVIAGLTRYTNKGHLARAVLEATAFQTREVVEAMEKDSGIALDILRTDGGMVEDDLLMQFQADILNRPVVRPAIKETTALGACYAAGLAVGFFKDFDDLRSRWSVDHTWQPDIESDQREAMYSTWKKAVTRSFDWLDSRPAYRETTTLEMKRKDSMGARCFGEFVGTAVLILLGDGVVANVLLKRSKAEGAGWLAIAAGWAFAVVFGVFTAIACGSPDAAYQSGSSRSAWRSTSGDFSKVSFRSGGADAGRHRGRGPGLAALPAALASDRGPRRQTRHASRRMPAIRNFGANLLERDHRHVRSRWSLLPRSFRSRWRPSVRLPVLGPYLVGVLVWAIGLSLGGTTGYAINPARDLGPRIAHAILPLGQAAVIQLELCSDTGYRPVDRRRDCWIVRACGPFLNVCLDNRLLSMRRSSLLAAELDLLIYICCFMKVSSPCRFQWAGRLVEASGVSDSTLQLQVVAGRER